MNARSVALRGSTRSTAPETRHLGALDGSTRVEASLYLRRRAEIPADLVNGPSTVTQGQLAERYGADPADVQLVRDTLARYGLEVTEADHGARRLKVSGRAEQHAEAFGVQLNRASSPDPLSGRQVEHRHREGELRLPAELDGVVTAVLGLDDRPQTRPYLRRLAPEAGPGGGAAAEKAAHTSYTPPQLGELYGFPAGTDGSGHNLAVIELGGGFDTADLDAYFSALRIPTPKISAVGVDGGSNVPGQDPQGADGEVLLDIEVAGALAPGATQVVYFAPNTDQGFVDAVSTAVHAQPTPTAVSISWGGPENQWTAQARNALDQAFAEAAALGVTVTAAAGDSGSSDSTKDGKPHTDFPAASPHVLACGGTRLVADSAIGSISSEQVWNDGSTGGATGGGVSAVFAQPSWQANAGVPKAPAKGGGRGVPDVAGDASPTTGYQVRVDGQDTVIGGTSAVAPLWAALVCRLSQALGKPLGLLQPLLYAGAQAGQTAPGFHDITAGNNGAYSAAPGWDPCTGLGSPNGTALLAALRG
ncbi:S53 family peptidase [Phaeacidiphilus oryzae]|uniref:S53 family peptidase n=1 Tax=Phaeacidiphilus oryzae TaxID=348818 RepID=UPI000568A64D|nr:S53 family peptidase [Phaeacidiphilus oryzae]